MVRSGLRRFKTKKKHHQLSLNLVFQLQPGLHRSLWFLECIILDASQNNLPFRLNPDFERCDAVGVFGSGVAPEGFQLWAQKSSAILETWYPSLSCNWRLFAAHNKFIFVRILYMQPAQENKETKKTMFWRLLWAGPSSDNSFPKKKDGHWSVTKTKHVFLGGHVYRWSLIYIWQVVPETWPEISKWFKVYLVQLAFGILWLYIHHPRLCPLYLHVANYFRLCLARPNSCWPCHVCWISPVLCWLYPSTLLVDDMLRIYNRSLPARIFHVDTHTHPYISIVCRIGARTNLRETTRFDAKNHGSQIQIPSGNQTWQHLGRWFSHSHAHV
jgi:hypothetical protein